MRSLEWAAALALALSVGPVPTKLAFEPASGSSVTKTFTTEAESEVSDMSLVFDGNDMSAMMGEFSIVTINRMTHVVVDEYLEVSDGRAVRLKRTFDTLEMTTEAEIDAPMPEGGGKNETDASSALEGESVSFEWDAEAGEYTVSFADEDSDADDALLEGLEVDMDLLALLPDGPVEEGASWEVPLDRLKSLYMPGGDVRLVPEGADEADLDSFREMFDDITERLTDLSEDGFEGSLRCTFEGTREEGGTRLGVVALALDIDFEADLLDVLEELLAGVLSSDQLPVEIEVSIDLADVFGDLTGEGQLLWNLDAGRVHSMQLSAEYDLTLEIEGEFGVEDETTTVEVSMEMSGSYEHELSTE